VRYFLRHVGSFPVYDINIRVYENQTLHVPAQYQRILSGSHQWLSSLRSDRQRPVRARTS
jgi:hypothetical protein